MRRIAFERSEKLLGRIAQVVESVHVTAGGSVSRPRTSITAVAKEGHE
jgi:hypothetical protein